MQNEESTIELFFSTFVFALSSWDSIHHSLPELSEPLCEFVETFRGPKNALFGVLERIMRRVVETHRMIYVLEGKSRCKNKLVHSSLLVLARIAFRCGFPNCRMVSRLLGEIYCCDKDLRKVLMGAYLEPESCFAFLLYKDRAEGLGALEYFLHHTNVAKKVFIYERVPKRLADLSLHIPNYYHPAVYAIFTNRLDVFKLLVKYGTNLCDPTEPKFRYSVKMRMLCGLGLVGKTQDEIEFRKIFFRVHPELEKPTPSLLELSRKVLRINLCDNFQVPDGIRMLPLPPVLKQYVDVDLEPD